MEKGRKATAVFFSAIVVVLAMVALVLTRPPADGAIASAESSPATADPTNAASPTEETISATASTARSKVTGWMPYWATGTSLDAVLANRSLFREVSPFWYQVVSTNGKATIRPYALNGGATRASVREALQGANIKVIPSVVDDSPARFLAGKLRSLKSRTALVRELVDLAVTERFDGLDLDLENFAFKDGKETWAKTRPAWVAFVKQLSQALKAQKKVLAVTTPPIYNRDYTPSSGYWVYDWESIAPYVYRLRIMTYDYSFDKAGPIGPLNWAAQVVDFAKTIVPAKKIEMGAPAYGRNWVTRISGTCPSNAVTTRTYVDMKKAEELAALRGATPKWDATAAEATFSYSLTYSDAQKSCTVFRTVWYPTPQSLSERSAFAASRGIGGVAIWSLSEVSGEGWKALE